MIAFMTAILIAARVFLTFLDMLLVIYVICNIISMLTRSTNPVFEFINRLTNPILYPVRKLLSNIEAVRSMPIDFSVLITFFIISILRSII